MIRPSETALNGVPIVCSWHRTFSPNLRVPGVFPNKIHQLKSNAFGCSFFFVRFLFFLFTMFVFSFTTQVVLHRRTFLHLVFLHFGFSMYKFVMCYENIIYLCTFMLDVLQNAWLRFFPLVTMHWLAIVVCLCVWLCVFFGWIIQINWLSTKYIVYSFNAYISFIYLLMHSSRNHAIKLKTFINSLSISHRFLFLLFVCSVLLAAQFSTT